VRKDEKIRKGSLGKGKKKEVPTLAGRLTPPREKGGKDNNGGFRQLVEWGV